MQIFFIIIIICRKSSVLFFLCNFRHRIFACVFFSHRVLDCRAQYMQLLPFFSHLATDEKNQQKAIRTTHILLELKHNMTGAEEESYDSCFVSIYLQIRMTGWESSSEGSSIPCCGRKEKYTCCLLPRKTLASTKPLVSPNTKKNNTLLMLYYWQLSYKIINPTTVALLENMLMISALAEHLQHP